MRVKIGDKVHDGEKESILLLLSKEDKHQMTLMHADASMFYVHPDDMSEEDANKFVSDWQEGIMVIGKLSTLQEALKLLQELVKMTGADKRADFDALGARSGTCPPPTTYFTTNKVATHTRHINSFLNSLPTALMEIVDRERAPHVIPPYDRKGPYDA